MWRKNMPGYLSADTICSKKQTVSFQVQIISADKYPSIFSPQMEAIVFIILQTFFAGNAQVFKIGEYDKALMIFPSFICEHIQSRDAFRQIARGRLMVLLQY